MATPRDVPYFRMEIGGPFALLTSQQKLYAHYFNTAAWHAVGITCQQTSPESLPLLHFYYKLASQNTLDEVKAAARDAGLTDDDVNMFFEYFALLYANMGNYFAFGDSRFVPACAREAFVKIAEVVPHGQPEVGAMAAAAAASAYVVTATNKTIGMPPNGQSAYYTVDVTKDDTDLAERFLKSKGLLAENTRVGRLPDGAGIVIRFASIAESTEEVAFEGKKVVLQFGDYKEQLQGVRDNLVKAKEYAANDTQAKMLDEYVLVCETGKQKHHWEAQRLWVGDKGPAVETTLGFIETYRDPAGVRGEWEGLVAIVDKKKSAKYGAMVANGESFVKRLPWGPNFEKDTFLNPDFTSLEVLGLAGSMMWAGINLPNYDDIRQTCGFKNVYLSNIVGAVTTSGPRMPHMTSGDWEVYTRYHDVASAVGVGIHELLGHGTGKLLQENTDGTFNFANDGSLINPLTKVPVATWYKPGETWGSVFGGIANAYEECRAEAVALYLSLERDMLALFDLTTEAAMLDTIRVVWVNMVRAGIIGLGAYTPETKQWRQAHSRGRFCILQTLLRAPNSIVTIQETEDGTDFEVHVDASRIETDGKAAIGDLLCHLNIYKATADVAAGTAYFTDLTEVDERFLRYRTIIMDKGKPRRQFVQAHTTLTEDGGVELHEFDADVAGAVNAFVARHKDIPLGGVTATPLGTWQ